MPTEIYLVKAGMTMTEGMVAEWHIADGDRVETGQLLYEMETEKITLEVDAEASGIVRHLVDTGISCDPGQVVGYIYGDDEDIPEILPAPAEGRKVEVTQELATAATDRQAAPPADSTQPILASPIAKKLARKAGLSLAAIVGTGPGGRITEADVAAALLLEQTGNSSSVSQAEGSPGQPADAKGVDVESLPITGMRRTIARRMHDSLQESAQLTMDMTVAMDEALTLREQLIQEWQAQNVRPTITDLVLGAVTKALQVHPLMNSQMKEDEILLHQQVHLGMAVALDEGLLVPVIKNAQQLDLLALCGESSRLATAAKNGTLGIDDLQGGTFSVSAMGMFGVDSFTPILNSPQVGILGVNRVYDGVSWDNDQPVRTRYMKLSLTWDHRVLDGAPAARFLQTVCQLLEAPSGLMNQTRDNDNA